MLDVQRLESFLKEVLPASASVIIQGHAEISGGYNSQMSRVDALVDDAPRRFTVRRDLPADRTLVEVDRRVEWAVLETLAAQPSLPIAPRIVGFDPDGAVVGSPTIVLEYVEGGPLQAEATESPERRPDLLRSMIDLVARAHRADLALTSGALPVPADWDSYIDSHIAEWRAAEADHVEPDPYMRHTAAWLERHRPPPAPLALVHGDFQSSNVLLTPEGDVILIDWEFAHVGDPREDLGYLQAIEPLSPPLLYAVDPEAACAQYRKASGLDERTVNPDTVAYFSVLVLGRLVRAVLGQMRAFVDGQNRSLAVPYTASAMAGNRWQTLQLMDRLSSSPALSRGDH